MKFDILGQKIPVIKEESLITGKGIAGYYDPSKVYISVDKSLKGKDLTLTILHEVVHAVLLRVGLHCTAMHSDLHEIVCENVSNALYENKTLIKKLLD